jgi:hypothetical protein
LDEAVFLELTFGVGAGDLGGDFAGILQNLAIGSGDKAVEAGFPVAHGHGNLPQGHVFGDVEGRLCVVVDDMIDTGGTIAKAAQTLMDFGAKDVIVAATHGILSKPAAERLRDAPISEVVVTNTLPIPEDQRFDKLTILSIAPILARAVYEVFTDGSVTRMFEEDHESSA